MMDTVSATIDGHSLVFHLNAPDCPVQGRHRVGKFYERADLDRVAQRVPPGAHVIDVGANVGNHALYFATIMRAKRVFCVEPNPRAIEALRANVAANTLGGVIDLSVLGVGLSDRAEGGFGIREKAGHLGAARLARGGSIEVHRGDDLFSGQRVDLIKIDVEGMEMQVLAGFEQVIEDQRPALFIEVDEENAAAFDTWRVTHGYAITFSARHQKANINHFLQPLGEEQ